MRLRRSTKLLLPLLVVCLMMWAISRSWACDLTVRLTERRSLIIGSGEGIAYLVWAPFAFESTFTYERLEMPAPQPAFAALWSRQLPNVGFMWDIRIRWWLICAAVLTPWLMIWSWRRWQRKRLPAPPLLAP